MYKQAHPALLCYREYQSYTGGHQKFRHYIEHLVASLRFHVLLYAKTTSSIQPTLFDNIPGVTRVNDYQPREASAVFLAGMDWEAYLPHYREQQLRINLVQHVRHADKAHPLFQFLKYPAVRWCVSRAVVDAIKPYANGPCIHIPMGHVLTRTVKQDPTHDLYILGTKQPQLATRVAQWASERGWSVVLQTRAREPSYVEACMSTAWVTLALPNPTEGFYLPGIEAMTYSKWAVVPNCVASNEWAQLGMPVEHCQHTFESCCDALVKAQHRARSFTGAILRSIGHYRLLRRYSLNNERRHVLRALDALNIKR